MPSTGALPFVRLPLHRGAWGDSIQAIEFVPVFRSSEPRQFSFPCSIIVRLHCVPCTPSFEARVRASFARRRAQSQRVGDNHSRILASVPVMTKVPWQGCLMLRCPFPSCPLWFFCSLRFLCVQRFWVHSRSSAQIRGSLAVTRDVSDSAALTETPSAPPMSPASSR